ncbi:hypothetical protein HG536_0A09600 [Torulaspora globosa]|uniref:FAD/NAD(P)-binding domain-containing protein n=1 Tax=Torulaspora globosa TaxID=48254 RepID=A0A7G3ZCA7_9SACH|nr:uncharacterized protein HG536_0A09600 [Torulaspora globosa]QLL31143.1 hypothetical protein HG536_0A09600 [Torulaspora globosa]
MTREEPLKIRSVAVIGSGAAGLTALFELLHTKKDGSTTIRYKDNGDLDDSKLQNDDPAFTKVVAFEQASRIGGIWAPSFDNPDVIPQEALDTEQYNDPFILKPKTVLPEQLARSAYSAKRPLSTKNAGDAYTWHSSGIYRHLYSNVPSRYLRNSFIPYNEEAERKAAPKNPLDPLITNGEITHRLLQFANKYRLVEHVRLNSEVVSVKKDDSSKKWELTVKLTSPDGTAQWYSEPYDAVIVSSGHYSVPYIPHIKGLSSWNRKFNSSVLHSKSFRDPKVFKNKVCLFIGTGLSGIDILQYAFPIAKQVIVSRSSGKEEIFKWLTNAANSNGIVVKPKVKELNSSNGREVVFEDGSSIPNVDHIVLSTGYHWHYPFLNPAETGVRVLPRNGTIPDCSSMVDGLYLNIFSIKDPTLAFVGVTVTSYKWPSFELEASAIAGVWANNSGLPGKEELLSSEQERRQSTGDSVLYHYYSVTTFTEYLDKVSKYLPEGRKSSDIFDSEHIDDMHASMATAERLFYQFKNGKIPIEDTL